MKQDITIYLKNGETLRFNDVKPIAEPEKTAEQIEETSITEAIVEEAKDELTEFIRDGYHYRFTYKSKSTQDINFASINNEDILGVSITKQRYVKQETDKPAVQEGEPTHG